MLEKPKYTRIQSYGSMTSSRSDDDMTVHSQLFPYPKKMVVEREILYEEEHPPFQPLFATTRIFGKARFTCLMALYLCFYVLYLIAGAIVFSALELPFENDIRVSVFRAKEDFIARNPTVLGKYVILNCLLFTAIIWADIALLVCDFFIIFTNIL